VKGRFKKMGLLSLRKIQIFITIIAFVQWSIWGLSSLSGQRNNFLTSTCIPNIGTINEVSNILNKRSCCQAFTAAPSLKNVKKDINGLPYMKHYHIYSNWKITQITLQAISTAVKKSVHLITLLLIVMSSPSYYLINHTIGSVFRFSN
jgi:hypothetical protein